MTDWVRQLARFHQNRVRTFPASELLLLFHLLPDLDNLTQGMIHLLRWFQIQRGTDVALYSEGEPEESIPMLNEVNQRGFPHRLTLKSDHLFLSGSTPSTGALQAKQYFVEEGYSVFAVIDPVAVNLESLRAQSNPDDTLLVHQPKSESGAVSQDHSLFRGSDVDLLSLISEEGLPEHIQYCWHGINESENLEQFLHSSVTWGEVDVREHPKTGDLITRHDSYRKSPEFSGEQIQYLTTCLEAFKQHNRRIKVDFKQGGRVIQRVLKTLKNYGFSDDEVWFHGDIHKLYPRGFNQLRAGFPGATIQTTIDSLGRLIISRPRIAKRALNMYVRWGVDRFLITWQHLYLAKIMTQMEVWGYAVNVYQIPDLRSFLQAVLYMPAGITSDYNFPEWNRFGRGSGQDLKWHIYTEYPEKTNF